MEEGKEDRDRWQPLSGDHAIDLQVYHSSVFSCSRASHAPDSRFPLALSLNLYIPQPTLPARNPLVFPAPLPSSPPFFFPSRVLSFRPVFIQSIYIYIHSLHSSHILSLLPLPQPHLISSHLIPNPSTIRPSVTSTSVHSSVRPNTPKAPTQKRGEEKQKQTTEHVSRKKVKINK